MAVELHVEQTDGGTNMAKLIVAFRISANAPFKTFANTRHSVWNRTSAFCLSLLLTWWVKGVQPLHNYVKKVKVKVKAVPSRHWGEVQVQLYPHWTSALEGDGWVDGQRHAPAALSPWLGRLWKGAENIGVRTTAVRLYRQLLPLNNLLYIIWCKHRASNWVEVIVLIKDIPLCLS